MVNFRGFRDFLGTTDPPRNPRKWHFSGIFGVFPHSPRVNPVFSGVFGGFRGGSGPPENPNFRLFGVLGGPRRSSRKPPKSGRGHSPPRQVGSRSLGGLKFGFPEVRKWTRKFVPAGTNFRGQKLENFGTPNFLIGYPGIWMRSWKLSSMDTLSI